MKHRRPIPSKMTSGSKPTCQGTIYKQKVSRVGVVVSSILKSFINLKE